MAKPKISPTYASPGLRWGLALEDHAEAYVEFEERLGSDLGIPESQGGNDPFCVATIHFPDDTKRKPVLGYKALASHIDGTLDHPSDRWNILCTKALGRALKRAGYPDDMNDLKALVHWRQRDAEIKAIESGAATIALTASQPDRALDAAGKRDSEATSEDDADAPDTETVDAIVVDDDADTADPTLIPCSDESKAELRKAITALGPRSGELTKWARENGLRVSRPATEWEASQLIAQAAAIAADTPGAAAEELAPPADEPSADEAPVEGDDPTESAEDQTEMAEQITELASGLDKEETKAYLTFLKSIDVDSATSPRTWAPSVLTEVLGWLEVGS